MLSVPAVHQPQADLSPPFVQRAATQMALAIAMLLDKQTQVGNDEEVGEPAQKAPALPDWVELMALCHFGPTMTRNQLPKGSRRTRSYELEDPEHENFDPEFPQGFKTSSSTHAPTLYFTHEIVVWLKKKAERHRQQEASKIENRKSLGDARVPPARARRLGK